MNNQCWFKPKRYGFGFGLPITRQGWLALFVLLVTIGISIHVNDIFNPEVTSDQGLRFLLDLFLIVSIFTALFKDRVEGGLKWRWGNK